MLNIFLVKAHLRKNLNFENMKTKHVIRYTILSILYYLVFIGGFISSTFKGTLYDWSWYFEIIFFAIIISSYETLWEESTSKLIKLIKKTKKITDLTIKKLFFSIIYYLFSTGIFINLAFKDTYVNWEWWISVNIFLLIVIFHTKIDKFITKYNSK